MAASGDPTRRLTSERLATGSLAVGDPAAGGFERGSGQLGDRVAGGWGDGRAGPRRPRTRSGAALSVGVGGG
ncbi:hypothetical protein ACRAKI_08975 [Saccharothrix isguenensis]